VIPLHTNKPHSLLDIDWLKMQTSGQLQGQHCKTINKYSNQQISVNITEIKIVFIKISVGPQTAVTEDISAPPYINLTTK